MGSVSVPGTGAHVCTLKKKNISHCFPCFEPYLAMGPASLPDAGAHVCTITKTTSTPSTNSVNWAMELASWIQQTFITFSLNYLVTIDLPDANVHACTP